MDHVGSSIVLPGVHLLWSAKSVEDITLKSLAPITMVEPRSSKLVIGTGRTLARPPDWETLSKELRQRGIVADIMDSVSALSNINMMMMEGRSVAGALLALEPTEDGSDVANMVMIRAALRKQEEEEANPQYSNFDHIR